MDSFPCTNRFKRWFEFLENNILSNHKHDPEYQEKLMKQKRDKQNNDSNNDDNDAMPLSFAQIEEKCYLKIYLQPLWRITYHVENYVIQIYAQCFVYY